MVDRVTSRLPLGSSESAAGASREGALLRGAGLALAGTAIVAAAAHVSIPLPFTPVPFTLQPLAVLLIGLLFGPILGFSTLCLYLLEGIAGLPVFQPFGAGGVAQLLGPTGGFLLAYPLVAAVAGGLFRTLRLASRYAAATIAGCAAMLLLFVVGAAQLGTLLHLSTHATLFAAVLPFLPGEFVKVLAAAGIATAWQHRAR